MFSGVPTTRKTPSPAICMGPKRHKLAGALTDQPTARGRLGQRKAGAMATQYKIKRLTYEIVRMIFFTWGVLYLMNQLFGLPSISGETAWAVCQACLAARRLLLRQAFLLEWDLPASCELGISAEAAAFVVAAGGSKVGTVAVDNGWCTGDIGSGFFFVGVVGPASSLGVAKHTGMDAFSRASATSSSGAWQ